MNRKERIQSSLEAAFQPEFIEVIDESHRHHVPENAQTHYKVTLVSKNFSQMTRIKRHRLINHQLKEELENGLHALSLHLFTPEEWQKINTLTPLSPACRDGYDRG